jgi:hypothetical protein
MFWNVLTLIGFIIALLTWFNITPRRLGEATKKYVFSNKLIISPIISSAFVLPGLIIHLKSAQYDWWLVSEGIGVLFFIWLVYISLWLDADEKSPRVLKIICALLPVSFVIATIGQINQGFNTEEYKNRSVEERQIFLIVNVVSVFFYGLIVGVLLFDLLFLKRILEVKVGLRKLQKDLADIQVRLKKRKNATQ